MKTCKEAFEYEMRGRDYGQAERADAFAWFSSGWDAAHTKDDDKDRIPYAAPWTDEHLREIERGAKASGDIEKADLAHAAIWAREFCDQAKDAATAMARETRRLFGDVLGQGRPREAALASVVAEMLDGKPVGPTEPPDNAMLRLGGSSWSVRVLVEDLRRLVTPARNFVEMLIEIPGDGPYRVIVQRPEGASPSALIRGLKEEIAELKRDMARGDH